MLMAGAAAGVGLDPCGFLGLGGGFGNPWLLLGLGGKAFAYEFHIQKRCFRAVFVVNWRLLHLSLETVVT